MTRRPNPLFLCWAFVTALSATVALGQARLAVADESDGIRQLRIEPETFELTGRRQRLQLLVTGVTDTDSVVDLTRAAKYRVVNEAIVSVDGNGQVIPRADGSTQIEVRAGGLTESMTVSVSGQLRPEPVSFEYDTLPVLAKAGCSGGACHGSPHGKAGFRLSLFGFEPHLDRGSVSRQFNGRRVNRIEPAKSLLLRKPTMQIPHAGGRRLQAGSAAYRLLHDWIAEGCQDGPEEVRCTGVRVQPRTGRVLRLPLSQQQFRVDARFSDGSVRDVTRLAQFSLSNPDVAAVEPAGRVTGTHRGETAVIVRYLEFIEAPLLTFVGEVEGFEWRAPAVHNFVDELVDAKLRQLRIQPADVCSDSVFVRRVHLDLLGRLPAPHETIEFLDVQSESKRSRLIDRLLQQPEFARYQAQQWGDLLRVSRKQLGLTGVFKYSRWLESAMGGNLPYDQFARRLLTASGSTWTDPAGNYYRTAGDTLDAMETSAQLFLGIRMQCAKCHHHPFERWTQDDYYGLAAFFSGVERQKTGQDDEVRLVAQATGSVRHPGDGRLVPPTLPGSPPAAIAGDPRVAFVDWLTAADNPHFAKVEVNRLWTQVMGRGIVEPFDDFRDSNPPANAPLLDALAAEFVRERFDRRQILRIILNSRTYQAQSRPQRFNREDRRYFSWYQPRRLSAEQLVDALGDVTGRREQFPLVAAETRAVELPAPDLAPPDRARLGDVEFLKVFGQPERQTVCSCDRTEDTSLGQALELLNGQFLHRMLEDRQNRFHTALAEGTPVDAIIADLYLRALSRRPDPDELAAARRYVDGHPDPALALEDLCWAIVNKDEFLFQH